MNEALEQKLNDALSKVQSHDYDELDKHIEHLVESQANKVEKLTQEHTATLNETVRQVRQEMSKDFASQRKQMVREFEN